MGEREDGAEEEEKEPIATSDVGTWRKMKAKVTGGGCRGTKWKILKYMCLCYSWKVVITEPIIGSNQTNGVHWNRIKTEFDERKYTNKECKMHMNCNQNGMQHKWSGIQLWVNKCHNYLETIHEEKRVTHPPRSCMCLICSTWYSTPRL
jgi:hypothetical protein